MFYYFFLSSIVNALDLHGFISQGYINSSKYNFLADSQGGSFRFNELGVNFYSPLTNNLYLGGQLISRGLGTMEKNEIKLDWASIDYHWRDWLGIRLGKVKIPIGFYTDLMDVDTTRTQIIPPSSVYNVYLRDILLSVTGSSIYGNLELKDFGDLDYTFFWGKLHLETDSSLEVMLSKNNMDINQAKNANAIGINLKWNSPFGLRLNNSYMYVNNIYLEGNLTKSFPQYSFSFPYLYQAQAKCISSGAEYNWKAINVIAESLIFDVDNELNIVLPHGINTANPLLANVNNPSNYRYKMGGWYGQISYRFNKWFELASYYSVHYQDLNDKHGKKSLANGTITQDYEAWQKDLAITGRFDLNENWIIKLEAHLMDGTALATGQPDGRNWSFWALKTTFTF